MSNTRGRSLKRTVAGVSAGMLALTGFAASFAATPASATAAFAAQQIGGDTRYDTAAQIALKFGTADNVILASGEAGHFVDALAANYLAGVKNAPILLTRAGAVPAATTAALATLKAKNVYVIGAAVTPAVASALTAYNVIPIAGATRYDTSVAVAAAAGVTSTPTAILVSGEAAAVPDALAAGPLSYAAHLPIIITRGGGLTAQTAKEISDLGIKNVLIVGGTARVSTQVETDLKTLGVTVLPRLAGATRQETALAVANYELTNAAFAGSTTVSLANGTAAPDALAGGPLAGRSKSPLLLTASATSLGAAATSFLTTNAKTLTTGYVFGGPDVVAPSVVAAATTAAQTATSNQSIAVTPEGSSVQEGGTSRQYVVTGLDNTKTYSVVLVNSANVNAVAGGTSTFTQTTAPTSSTPGSGVLAQGTVTSSLSVVNGTVASGTVKANVVPVNGVITFTVTGPLATAPQSSVTPVVFQDANANGSLDVNTTTGAPTEPFGIGGATVFTPTEATAGLNPGTWTVTTINRAAGATSGSFTAMNGSVSATFKFDANDTFTVGGAPATEATFLASLSVGDTLTDIVYATDPAASSSFALTNAVPTAVTLTTSASTTAPQTSILVSFTASTNATGYAVYRAPATAATSGGTTTYSCPTFPTTGTSTAPFVQVGTISDTGAANYTFTDVGLTAATNYCYTVVASNPGAAAAPVSTTTPVMTAATAQARPASVYAAETTSAGLAGTLDAGDVISIAFDKPVTVAAGTQLQVRDADGTIAVLDSSNATFAASTGATVVNGTSYAAGQVVTVTVTGAPSTFTAAGTLAGLQYPLTIVDQGGIAGTGGSWNIAGSTDVTVEQ